MTPSILYCGDTSLDQAAGYLAGLMTSFGWQFDYVPSHVAVTRDQIESPRSLLILSDYPAQQFDPALQEIVVRQVQQGLGLLMIGGWESYHGLGGNWDSAPLARSLPVLIADADDRINFDQPALLHPADWRSELWGLPWFLRPPTVGGMNRFQPRPGSEIWLSVTPFAPQYESATESIRWSSGSVLPALVTGAHGSGRTAAFASDVAPHWVGGFVDWGADRVTAQAAGAGAIEVGSDYASFWKHLLTWTGRLDGAIV